MSVQQLWNWQRFHTEHISAHLRLRRQHAATVPAEAEAMAGGANSVWEVSRGQLAGSGRPLHLFSPQCHLHRHTSIHIWIHVLTCVWSQFGQRTTAKSLGSNIKNYGNFDFFQFLSSQSACIFQIPWKHAARHGWSIDRDATLFRSWAMHTGTSHALTQMCFYCAFIILLKTHQMYLCSETRLKSLQKVEWIWSWSEE